MNNDLDRQIESGVLNLFPISFFTQYTKMFTAQHSTLQKGFSWRKPRSSQPTLNLPQHPPNADLTTAVLPRQKLVLY